MPCSTSSSRSPSCEALPAKHNAMPATLPLVQAYCDDLLLIAHCLPQFLEYAAAIAQYLADMGMSLNVSKCAYATTTRIPSIMVCLNPNNAAAPWVCLKANGTIPYLGLRLDPRRMASMKEKHVLRCEALLGWCKNTLGPASVPHEVMVAVVGGIVRYAAPCLSDTAETVVKLNAAIKAAALQFENLPKDLCNVAVRSGHGLRLADVRVICRNCVMATLPQLTHHRSAMVRSELRAILPDLHMQYGVCGQFLVPSTSFATHEGNTWVDRVLRAIGTLGVGLLMPLSVYSCVHAHLPQVQWTGRRWGPYPTLSRVGTSACCVGPARMRRCGPSQILRMTFCTRGSRAMSLGTGPFSSGTVTRTIRTFLTQELGPPSSTTYGSRDSKRSSGRGYTVP